MAPLNKTVFIDPLDVTEFLGGQQNPSPGFTQDVLDTLGNAGDSTDGFDDLVAGVGQLIDGWDQATAAQDADLDAVLALAGQSNPAPLDNSFSAFQGAFDTGNQIVATGSGLATPGLLELPLNPYFNLGYTTAPVQTTQDLGTRHVGDAPLEFVIGVEVAGPFGPFGISGVQIADGDPAIFSILRVPGVLTQFHWTFFTWKVIPFTDSVVITFTKPGKFTGQVNHADFQSKKVTFQTYTVTIEP